MKKKSAEFRAMARASLKGHGLLAVIVTLVATLLGAQTLVSNVSISISSEDVKNFVLLASEEDGWLWDILGLIAPFVVVAVLLVPLFLLVKLIFGGAVTLGYVRFYLNLNDRLPSKFDDIFSQFPRFGASFCMMFLIRVYVALWSLLFVIPGIVKSYAYAMAPYIMLENPRLTASECITASKNMMEGNKERLFFLNLSFIGWDMLCGVVIGLSLSPLLLVQSVPLIVLFCIPLLALGCVGVLMVEAYRQTAFAAFYREISGTEIQEAVTE